MKRAVIIAAGGSGTRMGGNIPKQFVLLNGKPILMHAIQRFLDFDPDIKVILVLPENEDWKSLAEEHEFKARVSIAKGGQARFESILNGLEYLTNESVVAIHDGVRPFCSTALIANAFKAAEKLNNAIPVINVTDTVRKFENENSSIIDRENLRIVQTPQCFKTELIKKAYKQAKQKNFTDDAGVFESAGNRLNFIEGERTNIKITYPGDLALAEVMQKFMFST